MGLWARRIPCPHFHSPRRRADLSGAFFIVAVLDRSVLVVASDAPRPVEDGVGAVGIDVDLDPRLDEMRAHWAFGDLELERAVGDAIVLADLALLLDAQDLVEIDARNGREGRALAGRIDGEAGVVLRQVDVRDEGVGRLDVGDGGELEFLWQPVLQRPERPFRSASGKGVGKDARLSTGYAANRPRCARPRAAQGPGRPGSVSRGRSRRPWWFRK